jgi:hypothetical protein
MQLIWHRLSSPAFFLTIVFFSSLGRRFAAHLAQTLVSLDLTGAPIDDRAIEIIAKSCRLLEVLRVNSCFC